MEVYLRLLNGFEYGNAPDWLERDLITVASPSRNLQTGAPALARRWSVAG
jgi:hypothetical protein